MMKFHTWICAFVILAGVLNAPAEANIASSKHNLSTGGAAPGQTIKAQTETELCIFCHIPHNANPTVPLWNHQITTAAYQMYASDYLTRAGYATPGDVGPRSRLCLSCHDGTVAVGSIYSVRGVAQATPIGMSGVDATGKILATSAGSLGTDLRNDHPVSIKYDAATAPVFTFGVGARTMELNGTAPPINPKPYVGVKLYGAVAGNIKGYVECTSCHDPHNDANPAFLVVSNINGALCTTCHSKTNWSLNIHQTSIRAINNPAGETQPIPGATVAQASCMGCHKSHSGQGVPYIQRKIEENTCYNGTSTSCHGASGAKNINTVFTRARIHPVATQNIHKNLDILDPTGALVGAGNRHSECSDCHNPHQNSNVPQRVAAASWYPSVVDATSNQVAKSGPLAGVTGVTPTTVPATPWVARTTFNTLNAATYEYQICYKCHSYFAILNAVTPIATWAGLSSAYSTDQAWEFSPGNRSAHPVEVGLNSQSGSTTPKPLAAATLSAPWNVNVGTQTMYCSDCHGADNENTTDPRGPHGANATFMLKGPNKTWPGAFTLANATTGQGTAAGLFCLNCHPAPGSSNSIHSRSAHRVACVRCHIEVPHGSKLSRLMAYSTPTPPWGAPYGSQSWLRAFKKPTTTGGYSESNCQTITTATGCSTHTSRVVTGAE